MSLQATEATRFREALDSVFAGPAYRWGDVPAPLQVIGEWRDELERWLLGLRAGNPVTYRLLVLGLLLALLLVLAHAGWVVWRTAQAAREHTRVPAHDRAERRDAAWYSRAADQAAAAGRLTEALQLAFVALVMSLHEQGLVQYHASKTPAEYAREARLAQPDRERLQSLVRALYAHIFGGRPLAEDDYRRWRAAGAPPWHATPA